MPASTRQLVKPPALRLGDTVGIVAPASNVKQSELEAGCEALRRAGYKPFYIDSILQRDLYFAGTAAVLIAVPQKDISGLQGITQAIDAVASRTGFQWIVPITALMVSLSAVGGVAAWFATAGRLPFVAGIDRVLPESFGRLHPKWGTPHVALLVQASAIVPPQFVLIIPTGTFRS